VEVLVFSQNHIKEIWTGTCLFSLAVPLHGETEELKIISVKTLSSYLNKDNFSYTHQRVIQSSLLIPLRLRRQTKFLFSTAGRGGDWVLHFLLTRRATWNIFQNGHSGKPNAGQM